MNYSHQIEKVSVNNLFMKTIETSNCAEPAQDLWAQILPVFLILKSTVAWVKISLLCHQERKM